MPTSSPRSAPAWAAEDTVETEILRPEDDDTWAVESAGMLHALRSGQDGLDGKWRG